LSLFERFRRKFTVLRMLTRVDSSAS
jgi:hypothetical protein